MAEVALPSTAFKAVVERFYNQFVRLADPLSNLFLFFYVCVFVAVDSVLKRMTIIGVILSFRSLAQEALRDVSHTLKV